MHLVLDLTDDENVLRCGHTFCVTIPKRLVQQLGWQGGDVVRFTIQGTQLVLEAKPNGTATPKPKARQKAVIDEKGIVRLFDRRGMLTLAEVRA